MYFEVKYTNLMNFNFVYISDLTKFARQTKEYNVAYSNPHQRLY